MLKAVCSSNIEELEACLAQGWDINAACDYDERFNAASLAAHLDKLEVLHFLDLRGADLSSGAGKVGNTPLMTGMLNWNVRIIDYLTERGVDPMVKDKYGFTALRKAQIKNLNTISSMLKAYELRYTTAKFQRNQGFINNITSKDWEERLKGKDLSSYKLYELRGEEAYYKPSDLLVRGDYPFSNMEENQLVMTLAGNYRHFDSGDDKIII